MHVPEVITEWKKCRVCWLETPVSHIFPDEEKEVRYCCYCGAVL